MRKREWQRGAFVCRLRSLCAAAGALALSACQTDSPPTAMNASPRGASVAFQSIDGPPQAQFYQLVQDLNDEAGARRLAVISREHQAAYRVRGYLAAKVVSGKTTISWIWDVFDADERRALRISGEETAKGRHRHGWSAADDAMLRRIASASMDQLAAFLTAPDRSAPNAPATVASIDTAASYDDASSREAAGIFRIFHPQADPAASSGDAAPVATAPEAALPLPRRHPTAIAVVPSGQTLSMALPSR
jgi:hypothetical protein